MKEDMKEMYLIDGSSFIYRAYFAIRGLSNSKGLPTNAVYGFINMLLKILNEKKPHLLAIAFDPKGPTKRHELFDEYKAQRPKMPDALSVQIPYIHRVVGAFNIPAFILEGYEADDVIGTVSKKGEADGYDVIIVSGDKDMFQLITPHVRVYDPMKEKIYGDEDVVDRFGVGPSSVVEIMGLMGDSSDNIPGVTGIGEKTAKELISAFGTIENLLGRLDEVKKPKLRSLLQEQGEKARLSRELAIINTGLPLHIDYDDFKIKPPDNNKIIEIFRELEFSNLLKHFTTESSSKDEDVNYVCISEESELTGILRKAGDVRRFSVYVDGSHTDSMTAVIKGVGLSFNERESCCIPVANETLFTEALTLLQIKDNLGAFIEDSEIMKNSHDIKRQMILLKRSGINPRGFNFDTMIASYLLNPGRADHSLEGIALEHLNLNLPSSPTSSDKTVKSNGSQRAMKIPLNPPFSKGETISSPLKTGETTPPLLATGETISPPLVKGGEGGFGNGFCDETTRFICQRADIIFRLTDILEKKLVETEVLDLFRNVEIPLAEVLSDMEMAGIRVNPHILMSLSKELERDMGMICQRIYTIAGEEFNINSPKQLSNILFNKIGMNPIRKTRTGYSTDEGVLTELALQHELPAEIMSYRQLAKLKSTYADALLSLINPETGRVHTSFSQIVAATGRLSSSKPNLQNIPVRTEMGQRIREAFIAKDGCLLLSADYSQIELRILAHMSGDELLTEAFRQGEDIHTRTAAEIFGLQPSDITPEMRRRAKAINFGIVYGISPYGLAMDIGITQQEAREYIDNYFLRYRGVKSFIEDTIVKAKELGYVTTLLNRRRYVPELASDDNGVRQFGERVAVNTPVQGSAADMIKLAMINIQRRLVREGLKAKMILQVHDELLFEVPEEELAAAKDIVIEEMEGVMALSVPIKADSGVGKNWREAG
ncbi:MAG: DNA polymerase I [Nitrospirae bacterium]|nr:DNA polymerase I [Nitrospirota bacterium]